MATTIPVLNTYSPTKKYYIERHNRHGWQEVSPSDPTLMFPNIQATHIELICPCNPDARFTVRRLPSNNPQSVPPS